MPDAEPVQPDEGQGGDSGSGLYDLSTVPEELRPQVEPLLKQFDANATKKFQQHAEYRKGWEPYEQIGINEYDPEGLQGLLQFAENVLADPTSDAFREWFTQVGREYDLLDFGEDAEDDDGLAGQLTPEQVEMMLEQRLAPFQEREAERDQQQRLADATEFIDSELKRLDPKGELDDNAQKWVMRAALAHDGEDAIEQAYGEYQELVSGLEKGVFSSKSAVPRAPEKGGRPAPGEGPPLDMKTAKAMAQERLRQMGDT